VHAGSRIAWRLSPAADTVVNMETTGRSLSNGRSSRGLRDKVCSELLGSVGRGQVWWLGSTSRAESNGVKLLAREMSLGGAAV
jgi:hypothetical protein